MRVNDVAALVLSVQREISEDAKESKKLLREEHGAAFDEQIEKLKASAAFEKAAAVNDMYIAKIDHTIGAVPIAGTIAADVITSSDEDLASVGEFGAAMFSSTLHPIFLPAVAIGGYGEARKALRAEDAANPGATDNVFARTVMHADKGAKIENDAQAKNNDIEATKAEKRAGDLKDKLDGAAQQLDAARSGQQAVFDGIRRMADKI